MPGGDLLRSERASIISNHCLRYALTNEIFLNAVMVDSAPVEEVKHISWVNKNKNQ